MRVPHCERQPVSFLPQVYSAAAHSWAVALAAAGSTPPPCHRLAEDGARKLVGRSRKACQNRAKSCWLTGLSCLESFMFSVFVPSETSLKKAAVTDLDVLPEGAVWIDLVKPTAAEDKAVERLGGGGGARRGGRRGGGGGRGRAARRPQ